MQTLYSSPKQDGFYYPAEAAPHQGCLLIWPHRGDSWSYGGYAARETFVKICEAIAQSEEVTVCAPAAQYDNARLALPDHIRVVELSSDDSWARDTAPIFLIDGQGRRRGEDFDYNAWGGLYNGCYFPWDLDRHLGRKVCDLYSIDRYDLQDFVLEGGSIHSDGEGTLLTTAACLLSPGRNPSLSQQEIEQKLLDCLGGEKVLWLPRGIYNDETDEHVDNVAAFVKPGEIVLSWTEEEGDPQSPLCQENWEYLQTARDAKGRKLKVRKLPLPKPVTVSEEECRGLDCVDGKPARTPGERLAASYANFYLSNKNVIMPAFGDPMDEVAANILADCFPERTVIQIPTREILLGGGNIHCLTQQIPAGID